MKRTRKKVIPAKPEQTVDEEIQPVCDLCKEIVPAEGTYDINKVIIEHAKGDSFPEGGSKTVFSFDVCPSCFEDKMIPWFAEQGATPSSRDSDW